MAAQPPNSRQLASSASPGASAAVSTAPASVSTGTSPEA
nr:hypothetical protein Docile-S101_00058 [Bovine alphaherpesvirus 1]